MKLIQVIALAALGAVVGVLASGLWWMYRDRSVTCLGGCTPADKDLPAGDITLMVGAAGGLFITLVLVLSNRALLLRRSRA